MINAINFDHTNGTIISNGESVIYEKQTTSKPLWIKSNTLNKYYRLTELRCTPNIWRAGNIYSTGFCVQDELNGNKFVCLQANDSSAVPLYINNEVNSLYWRSYNNLLTRMSNRSIIGEYSLYYNYMLYSEDLSKAVKLSELKEITTNKTSRKYLKGVELNNYLLSIKNIPWVNIGLNIKKSSSPLYTNNSWSIYALNQTTPSEHCVQQEIKISPNEIFSFSTYVQYENSKDFALAITLNANNEIYTYAIFFDISLGLITKTSVFDKNFNEINDPLVILNVTPYIEQVSETSYRVSFCGLISPNINQQTLLCKLAIPSNDGSLYYSSSTQKSILINCIQFCKRTYIGKPYKYIKTELQYSKGEARTGLYYKTPDSKFIDFSFDHKIYLNNILPNPSDYEDGDLLVLSNGISFPDGLKLGERINDTYIDKTLTYFIDNEYHETIHNEAYRLLTTLDNKWQKKMVNALTFNKFGFERFAGQQFKC